MTTYRHEINVLPYTQKELSNVSTVAIVLAIMSESMNENVQSIIINVIRIWYEWLYL